MAKTSKEEQVAVKILDSITDIRLDITAVGKYLVKSCHTSEWLRFQEIYMSANEEIEKDARASQHFQEMEKQGRNSY